MFIPQAVRDLGWRRGLLVATGVLTALVFIGVLIVTDARLENVAIRLFGGFISKNVERPQGVIYTAAAALGVAWVGIAGLCLWERWWERRQAPKS